MANIQSEQFTYSVDGTEMTAYLAWDSEIEGTRPGVLVVHEWWGMNDYARRRADMLAELGYTGMALDMYGGGQVADSPDEAGALMNGLLENLSTVRRRFNAALEAMQAHATVDGANCAAIGYCMGGGIVLHMARYGAGLKAVGSFHGALPLGVAAQGEGADVTARIGVYHGESDVLIPDEAVAEFRAEMEKTGADCLFIPLPTALHGFSNAAATGNGEKYGLPLRYDERADAASWNHLQLLLQSAFS